MNTIESFNGVLEILKTEEIIAFDFETMPLPQYSHIDKLDASLHHKMCDIEGISLRSDKLPATYIPFLDSPIPKLELYSGIQNLFSQDSLFVAHNMSFDAKIADYFFHVRPKNKFCTLVGYWYVNENIRKNKVSLAKELFGLDLIDYKTAKKMTDEDFVKYCEHDADFAYDLYFYIKEHLSEKLFCLVADLETKFIDVLIDMCMYGTHINEDILKQGEVILTDKALELEAKIYSELGEFNLNSPQQLCEKIYGIKIKRRKGQPVELTKLKDKKYARVTKWNHADDEDKRVPSTDEQALRALNTKEAILIKEYREVKKLLDTYAIGFQKWAIDGIIYPAFNHVGTVTGRLSSSNPNMQNISRAPSYNWWLRDAIYAPEGYKLIVADEGQLEIRVLAHFCRDPLLIEAINSGEDVHLATAKIIYGREEITKQERSFAKKMNFAIIYGQGIPAIAEELNITNKEAQIFRKKYFATFPDVEGYIEYCAQTMKEKGFVKTLLGRHRRIKEIYSSDVSEYARAKRQTVNSIIQGSASDILKLAMIRINEEFKEKKLDAHILLQIHDELVIQCAEDIVEQVCEITKRWMEHPFKNDLRVPLIVEPKICNIWSEGKE